MFDIKKLKTLIAIAEEGSLTKAADRLNTSQSWVSEQLKLMEERLDMALVSRNKGKFPHLTPAGERVIAIARKAVDAFDQATAEMGDLREREGRRVVVGTDPITLEMPGRNKLIIDFLNSYPSMELQIDNASHHDLFAGLRSGRFDMILALCPNPDPDVEILPMYDYEIGVFLPNTAADGRRHEDQPMNGISVLTVPDTFHPPFADWLRTASQCANLTWKACPETSFEALMRYAIFSGMPALAPNVVDCFPHLAARIEFCRLDAPRPIVATWALMRVSGYHRRASVCFWNLATRQREAEHAARRRDAPDAIRKDGGA